MAGYGANKPRMVFRQQLAGWTYLLGTTAAFGAGSTVAGYG